MSDIGNSASEELTLSARGYRIMKVLGEGSYAKVYLAEYRRQTGSTKAQLACKIVDTDKAPKDFVRKFLPRELQVLVSLDHPHIIHVHSIFQRKNKTFIFMRFAEQGDLLEYVSKKGITSEAQARVWFRQLALAIQYLHDMDIAHRDLKCENALITRNYNLKLADFGFARFVTDGNGKLVNSETYCGSLSYAAPEILKGQPYHPKPTDLWSLGVILFVMLNKSMPFDDHNARRLYEQQSKKNWKFRTKVVNTVSENVKKLVTSLLEPEPSRRMKIEQVLSSDWIAMDPRLVGLSAEEQQAKYKAQRRGTITDSARRGKLSSRPPVVPTMYDTKRYKTKTASVDDLKVIKDVSKTAYRVSDDADSDTVRLLLIGKQVSTDK